MLTKLFVVSSVALLTATVLFTGKSMAQSRIVIEQSGGAGNAAVVSQSGGSNQVIISQNGPAAGDSSTFQPGNQVSLRVAKGTETIVSQHGPGPNAVEISQDGRSSANINQSSGQNQNRIITLPDTEPDSRARQPAKRRFRRP